MEGGTGASEGLFFFCPLILLSVVFEVGRTLVKCFNGKLAFYIFFVLKNILFSFMLVSKPQHSAILQRNGFVHNAWVLFV